jgi:glycosyltransferase involved in cell wall biosynthesis
MKTIASFVTWQPVLTDHQAYTYLALQELSGVPVLSFVTAQEDAVRKSQGWAETRVSTLSRELVPGRRLLSFYLKQFRRYRDAIHIFASPFQQPKLMLALFMAAWMGVEFYLLSEPYSPIDAGYYEDRKKWVARLKSLLRPALYRLYVLLIGRRLAGIFAISKLAERQYLRAGIPAEKLMPFGYFVPFEPKRSSAMAGGGRGADPRFIFVGSLIRRKGVDLLAQAMRELDRRGVRCVLDFYGPGDAALLRGCPGAHYRGTIPFGGAQSVIANYDLLVLPSRHDGWGVVINEALCSGVPVLCSDTTGAGHAAAALGAGRLFVSDDLESLVRELEFLVTHGDLLSTLQTATSAAAAKLQPDVAAAYMLKSIRTPQELRARRSPPWYGTPA